MHDRHQFATLRNFVLPKRSPTSTLNFVMRFVISFVLFALAAFVFSEPQLQCEDLIDSARVLCLKNQGDLQLARGAAAVGVIMGMAFLFFIPPPSSLRPYD